MNVTRAVALLTLAGHLSHFFNDGVDVVAPVQLARVEEAGVCEVAY
jgi:hypothetical protein